MKRIMILLLIVLVLVGFAQAKQPMTPQQRAVLQTIYDNISAMNTEDFDAVMDTIHPQSPSNIATAQALPYLFENYDLFYLLESTRFLTLGDEKVEIKVTQTTRNQNSTEFNDNRVVAVHTLFLYKGIWMIYGTEVIQSEFLK